MIESVHFKNFKVLRDTALPLGQFTLIVGPNGSGKSTALQGLKAAHAPRKGDYDRVASVGRGTGDSDPVITVKWGPPHRGFQSESKWQRHANTEAACQRAVPHVDQRGAVPPPAVALLQSVRVYSLNGDRIAAWVPLNPTMELQEDGGCLAGVLDRLRDDHPERFESLNDELGRWLPEFDRILFDTPQSGQRGFALRTREGHHRISARELSQGTLLALAMLTLAYIPDPPWFVGFEEPDRGIHPRLLRDVRDAMYRLAYPRDLGEQRDPVQVVATTHSPYFVDLFSDHPEEIVIAEKVGAEAKFIRLTDLPNYEEILRDAHLGDAWYSGILGGVPSEP